MKPQTIVRTQIALLGGLAFSFFHLNAWADGALAQSKSASIHFQVIKQFPLSGEGGWDYLTYDPATQKLFIARTDRVQVVNPVNGELLGEVKNTLGVHGIAIAVGMDKAYTSNGQDNSITIFSPSTLKTIGKISTPLGIKPDFIIYDAATMQVIAFNGKSKNASIVDVKRDVLIATVNLEGRPEAAAVDGEGNLFVNLEDRHQVVRLDLRKHSITARWPLMGCHEAAAMSIDPASHRIFVGCHNSTLLMVDTQSGKVLTSAPIGEDVDSSGFDSASHLIFTSQSDGHLTILHEEIGPHLKLMQTVITPLGAKTAAFNEQTHQVYLVTAKYVASTKTTTQPAHRRVVAPNSARLLIIGEVK